MATQDIWLQIRKHIETDSKEDFISWINSLALPDKTPKYALIEWAQWNHEQLTGDDVRAVYPHEIRPTP